MTARALVLVAIAGCASRAGEPAPAAPPPARPMRPHVVQPLELLLAGAPEVGVTMARLARHHAAWLELDGEPQSSEGWRPPDLTAVAVAEVRDDRVRILHEEDGVRLLVWIARADLARVIANDLELGRAVLLRAGTPLAVGNRVEWEGLALAAPVEDAVVGDTWQRARIPERRGRRHVLAAGSEIRVAPGGRHPVIATTTEAIEVRAEHGEGGWRTIETLGPDVVVHGVVEDGELRDDILSVGSGGHYGSSHSISIDVPAGTCLYDAIGGAMIGITTEAASRLARLTDDEAWYHLLVNSPWGLLDIPIHDGGGGWDRCADL